jgi:hypothetical protein
MSRAPLAVPSGPIGAGAGISLKTTTGIFSRERANVYGRGLLRICLSTEVASDVQVKGMGSWASALQSQRPNVGEYSDVERVGETTAPGGSLETVDVRCPGRERL